MTASSKDGLVHNRLGAFPIKPKVEIRTHYGTVTAWSGGLCVATDHEVVFDLTPKQIEALFPAIQDLVSRRAIKRRRDERAKIKGGA